MAEVIVVEDEDLTRRLLEVRLESAGHLVRSAASIAEAQDLLARFGCPDVLISDMFMPGGSGLQLVTRLRAAPETAGLPVIFLSGRALPGDVGAARGLDASYLTKPFSPESLNEAITAALRPVDDGIRQTVGVRLAALGTLDEPEQELMAELLTAFVQRAPAVELAAIRAMRAEDAETLQSCALRLQTAARNLGADTLAEISAELGARAGRGRFPIPVALQSRFRRVLAATCRVFDGLVAEYRNEPADAVLPDAVRA